MISETFGTKIEGRRVAEEPAVVGAGAVALRRLKSVFLRHELNDNKLERENFTVVMGLDFGDISCNNWQ